MRYEANGCEDFVGGVLCNVLSQRAVDFLNFGCVPVLDKKENEKRHLTLDEIEAALRENELEQNANEASR